jgi:hypothetical protein
MFEEHCRQARVLDVWLEIMVFFIGKKGGGQFAMLLDIWPAV